MFSTPDIISYQNIKLDLSTLLFSARSEIDGGRDAFIVLGSTSFLFVAGQLSQSVNRYCMAQIPNISLLHYLNGSKLAIDLLICIGPPCWPTSEEDALSSSFSF
jgi:hypothetical protein